MSSGRLSDDEFARLQIPPSFSLVAQAAGQTSRVSIPSGSKDQRRPLVGRFLAKPVNLDNTVKSARIVFSRWLGCRTRAETIPRFVLKRGTQRLSKDCFPGPLTTQARSNFSGGLY
jgi:hypothetical protein